MTLSIQVDLQGFTLPEVDQRRMRSHLRNLERRLKHRPEPAAVLVLRQHTDQRRVEADLRIELGPLGPTLVSHQAAETPDLAIKRAVEDVERELERQVSEQHGDASFGVPSRREPRRLRPHPPDAAIVEPEAW
jgi:ribosome-associated translation inhibitor RaiA